MSTKLRRFKALTLALPLAALILAGCSSSEPEPTAAAEPSTPQPSATVPASDIYAQAIAASVDSDPDILTGRSAIEALLAEEEALQKIKTTPQGCSTFELDPATYDDASAALSVEEFVTETKGKATYTTAILGFDSVNEAAQYVQARQQHAQQCSEFSFPASDTVSIHVANTVSRLDEMPAMQAETWLDELDQDLVLRTEVESHTRRESSGPVQTDGQLPSYVADPNSIPEPENKPVPIDTTITVMVRRDHQVFIVTQNQKPAAENVAAVVDDLYNFVYNGEKPERTDSN